MSIGAKLARPVMSMATSLPAGDADAAGDTMVVSGTVERFVRGTFEPLRDEAGDGVSLRSASFWKMAVWM
jgi:hypothetical protein